MSAWAWIAVGVIGLGAWTLAALLVGGVLGAGIRLANRAERNRIVVPDDARELMQR